MSTGTPVRTEPTKDEIDRFHRAKAVIRDLIPIDYRAAKWREIERAARMVYALAGVTPPIPGTPAAKGDENDKGAS